MLCYGKIIGMGEWGARDAGARVATTCMATNCQSSLGETLVALRCSAMASAAAVAAAVVLVLLTQIEAVLLLCPQQWQGLPAPMRSHIAVSHLHV